MLQAHPPIACVCVRETPQLRSKFAHCPHEFPPRMIFPLRRSVVMRRRRDLQRFLKVVFTDPAMGATLEAKQFLGEMGDPSRKFTVI